MDSSSAINVIRDALSPDNTIRRAAERLLDEAAKDNLPSFLTLLIKLVGDAAVETYIRHFAAVLFKNAIFSRVSTEYFAFPRIPPSIMRFQRNGSPWGTN